MDFEAPPAGRKQRVPPAPAKPVKKPRKRPITGQLTLRVEEGRVVLGGKEERGEGKKGDR